MEKLKRTNYRENQKDYINNAPINPGDFTLYFDGDSSHVHYFVLKEKDHHAAIIIGITLNYNASDILVNEYKIPLEYLMRVDDSFVNIGSPLWRISEKVRDGKANEILITGTQAYPLDSPDDSKFLLCQIPY